MTVVLTGGKNGNEADAKWGSTTTPAGAGPSKLFTRSSSFSSFSSSRRISFIFFSISIPVKIAAPPLPRQVPATHPSTDTPFLRHPISALISVVEIIPSSGNEILLIVSQFGTGELPRVFRKVSEIVEFPARTSLSLVWSVVSYSTEL